MRVGTAFLAISPNPPILSLPLLYLIADAYSPIDRYSGMRALSYTRFWSLYTLLWSSSNIPDFCIPFIYRIHSLLSVPLPLSECNMHACASSIQYHFMPSFRSFSSGLWSLPTICWKPLMKLWESFVLIYRFWCFYWLFIGCDCYPSFCYFFPSSLGLELFLRIFGGIIGRSLHYRELNSYCFSPVFRFLDGL